MVCDVVARYERLKGKEVHFLTGTDEHGQKIERAAAERLRAEAERLQAELAAGVAMLRAEQRTLEVLWPAGTKQTIALQAWTRTVRHNPEHVAREF